KINVAEVNLDAGQLNVNDRIYIIGPNTGVLEFRIDELRDNNGNVIQFSNKNIVSFKVPSRVRKNDKVYLIKNRKND
ncbi:MAG: U32 family peptidase, partial [Bacteroidales bacterium]|nr:U32 family peptidase [Bacteroidales bacterium]